LFAAIAISLCAGIAVAGSHPGGVARELSMGGGPLTPNGLGPNIALNPFIFDDPTLILINPAYQQEYRNYGWFNMAGGAVTGQSADGYGRQFVGANFGFGKEATLGAVLSYDPSITNLMVNQLASFTNAIRPGGAQTGLRPVDVFEVTGTYDLGTLAVGVGVMYGWAKNTGSNATAPVPPASSSTELSASVFGFRAGALVDLGGGNAVDLSGAVRLDKATDNVDGTNAAGARADLGNYSASTTEIQVEGRLKLKMSNKVNFVPYAAFGTVSGEPKQDAPQTGVPSFTGSTKLSATLITVGGGMEYRITNFYFAGGLSYKMSKLKSEVPPPLPATGTTTSTASATEFPVINLGMEWTLLDWLTGRLGYYRTFMSIGQKTERPAGGSTTEIDTWAGNSSVSVGSYTGTDNSLITLGLGLHFGNFALDGTVSDQALRRGLGLIGAQDNINTFGYVTASYCFD
ncbi:MAG TPA: hypothetical protein VMM80_13095, partial [Bacteroidota bacterium]|nr:hypothetical protein [Bacteroidota bacterium]